MAVSAYGNFWNNAGFVTAAQGNPFPFNKSGPVAGGVSLNSTNPTIIKIKNAGKYRINWIVTVNAFFASSFPWFPEVALFVNGLQVGAEKTNFGIEVDNDTQPCRPIVGDTILSLPENAKLQLRNITSAGSDHSITTCDTVGNNVQLSLIKLD